MKEWVEMRSKGILVIGVLIATSFSASAQHTYPPLFENQLRCKSNPKAGKLLIDLRRRGFINRAYVVEDTVSYFKLNKPLRVLGFSPVGVFGFQKGYPRFFVRGPGTLPPETIGIVVRDDVANVKARLTKLGMSNLEVESHHYDLRGNVKETGNQLTQIACWERF